MLGREELHYLNAAPVHEIAHRWISRYDRARVRALADLKLALERTPMDAPTFVYTAYIRTTPQKLWQALTEPAFTRRYWATEFITDWSAGSPMTWDNHGVLISDPEQVVLEAEPYTRLSHTWHAITPELSNRFGWDEELLPRLSGEARSKVTFTIEETAQVVKLTVVHDGFEPGSSLAEMVGHGWPNVVSSLKSLLETGEPLPADA
ncbi:ArsR family transcriptional regulator [Planomonospora venezuelensis]|nr:ArsR family transcriptional regulator [Planomonospora venezuelensis]